MRKSVCREAGGKGEIISSGAVLEGQYPRSAATLYAFIRKTFTVRV